MARARFVDDLVVPPRLRRLIVCALLFCSMVVPAGAGQNASTSVPGLRIYLARHGESESNIAGLTTGWTDSKLTARGRQQARELADVMKGVRLDAIYSSTLSRSRDTALGVAGSRRVIELVGLRERNWGRFTGLPTSDSEFLRRRALDDDPMDGGESRVMFYDRVSASIAEVRKQHPSGTVLVVGHGATNQQILRQLLGLTAEQAETIGQANDEIYALDFIEGRPPLLWKFVRPKNLGDL